MTSINLLPAELRVKFPVAKFLKRIKKIAIVEAILLVFVVVLSVGSIYILSDRVSGIKDDSEKMKKSIQSLEGIEQRLFLVKDRTGKIDQVLSEENAIDEIEEVSRLLDRLPSGSKVSRVAAGPSQLRIVVQVDEAKDATSLFDYLNSSEFPRIVVSNFSASEGGGYDFNITMDR